MNAMTTKNVTNVAERIEELRKLNIDQVWEIARGGATTLQMGWRDVVASVFVLDEAGVDVLDFLGGNRRRLNLIRKVASGQIIPEAADKWFFDDPAVLYDVERLPVQEQRKLIEDDRIEVGVIEDGHITTRMMKVGEMTPQIRKSVLTKHGITPPTAHIAKLSERLIRDTPRKKVQFSIDFERMGINHRGEFISVHELDEAVKSLKKRMKHG